MTRKTHNTRAVAAQVINSVLQHGRSLGETLPAAQQTVADNDRSLLAELCYGTLRFSCELDAITQLLLQKPLQKKDGDIQALLLIGLYQLRHMRTAEHAAVSLSVDAAKALKKDWAGKLINGVLRNYLRQQNELAEKIARIPVAHHNHPAWLRAMIEKAWPEQSADIFAANNQPGGMTLRVNSLHHTAEIYRQQLADKNIVATTNAHAPSSLLLEHAVGVEALPGFLDGDFSVQDVAAQLCAPLLDLQPGQRALDACCAPGGKTGHMLELQPALSELVALDNDEKRLQRVHENLSRLHLQATVICADAAQPASWHDGVLFDRILLDAPCSGTGVIRRHPDIKHLRRESDIAALAVRQRQLLDNLWPLLQPGGVLLYTTCSILPQENENVINAFLHDHTDAEVKTIEAVWGIKTDCGRQLLPSQNNDGFYYSRLVKKLTQEAR